MPSLWHNSQKVCGWKLKELLSWLPQVTSYKYCAQKILDLELKHICLLLGQFGHLFSNGLDEGSRGDVGERRVRGVVVGQALLGSGGGGQRGLLQAGVQAALLAVLPRQAGGRVVLVAGPRVSLDVAREWDLWRSAITHNYTEQSIRGAACRVPQTSLGHSQVWQRGPNEGNAHLRIPSFCLQMPILACAIYARVNIPAVAAKTGKTLCVLIYHHLKKSRGKGFSESALSA